MPSCRDIWVRLPEQLSNILFLVRFSVSLWLKNLALHGCRLVQLFVCLFFFATLVNPWAWSMAHDIQTRRMALLDKRLQEISAKYLLSIFMLSVQLQFKEGEDGMSHHRRARTALSITLHFLPCDYKIGRSGSILVLLWPRSKHMLYVWTRYVKHVSKYI